MPASSESPTQVFPAPVYAQTVLAPLYEATARHYRAHFQAIDRAHLVMVEECGVITPDTAATIARGLAAIDAEATDEPADYTGEFEDYFFERAARLGARIGPDIAGMLHVGRSRNDIDHTVFKLALRGRIDVLLRKGLGLARGMLEVARREQTTLIVAYTHGQPAQPTSFGHYLAAALEVLLRDLRRLAAAREIVDLCPMGAAAITTTGFPLDRHRIALLLGFRAPLENSYGCIAAVDYVTATYSALELIFLHLGRLVQDLQAWSGFELGQIRLPDAYVQVSSIMPQKRNPVAIEHLRLLASHAGGRARAMLAVMHNTPFTDMNDSEAETHMQGYGAFDLGGRMLDLLGGLLRAVRIDAAHVARNIEASAITVTELADTLVCSEGISFREAHQVAGAVARHVMAVRGTLAQDGFAKLQESFGKFHHRSLALDEVGYREAVSPEHFVAVRARFGGPAPEVLRAAFARYAARLAAMKVEMQEAANREAAADSLLRAGFARLLESAT